MTGDGFWHCFFTNIISDDDQRSSNLTGHVVEHGRSESMGKNTTHHMIKPQEQ
jgi:hypothetical protein